MSRNRLFYELLYTSVHRIYMNPKRIGAGKTVSIFRILYHVMLCAPFCINFKETVETYETVMAVETLVAHVGG